jgi:hypothetical protein
LAARVVARDPHVGDGVRIKLVNVPHRRDDEQHSLHGENPAELELYVHLSQSNRAEGD